MNYNNLYSIPLFLVGLTLILLGVRWMVVDEPWMLDEVANIERLEMTFEDLFHPEINKTLPGYLRQIYRFFGFWVIIIGLFITFFSTPKIASSKMVRVRMLGIIFFMLALSTILGHSLIPSSHFIYLIWIMNFTFLICLFGHLGIKNGN